jgi:hypothetical protein
MSNLTDTVNPIFSRFKSWLSNGFTWDKIKKDAYNRVDVLNILLTNQNQFTYKYIDMVYYDLYNSIKPDISSFEPNTYDDELVLLNIKKNDTIALTINSKDYNKHMKLAYIHDNIHSNKQSALSDTKVYKTLSKNDAVEYCKEFVKFVETARKTPSRETVYHQLRYKLEHNCENVNHIEGLYVKINVNN